MSKQKSYWLGVIAIAVMAVLVLTSACAPTPTPTPVPPTATVAPAIPEVTINAADFSYTAPDSINAGWVRIKLTNTGQEPHHVQFLRLNDGVTLAQFQDALKQGPGPALAITKEMGGVGAIAPNGSAQVVINLTAGDYVILCFVESPSDHLPHLAKGMVKPISVKASTVSAREPAATAKLVLKDFQFEMFDTLSAGKNVIKVVNEGKEGHEWNLLQLAEGKTLQDVAQFMSKPAGPPPFLPVGGMNGLAPGSVGYAEIDLKPGKYVAICNIPEPNSGKAHSELGMIKEFTVK